LQQNRRFAGIHRRVVKVELGHSEGGAVKSLAHYDETVSRHRQHG